jgi:hypothetical protein
MLDSISGLLETVKMMYLMNIKELSLFQNLLSIICVIAINILFNNENINDIVTKYSQLLFEYFTNARCKTVILEGKTTFSISNYSSRTDNIFSDRFQAFWDYISNNNYNINSINSIKEYPESYCSDRYLTTEKKEYDDCLELMKSKNQFMVNQITPFCVQPNIYCKVIVTKSSKDDKIKFEIENIRIELYSYCYSHNYLTNFLDKINIEYKEKINNARNNKKFIYTLIGHNSTGRDETSNNSIWNECQFISSRTFNNLFFENKNVLLDKLNFFINNKEWYDYEGHPWTFGIGLHGPPGTGKTSVIKSIANQLNRHIIVIPLNKIKTQTQFNEYFFEEYYSNKNFKKINFSDKIIVFEDIDCMSHIVKKRSSIQEPLADNSCIDKQLHIQNNLLNKLAKKIDNDHSDSSIFNIIKENDDITLSYILNIIDGIRETPGRILIITSNNYDYLDSALVRPGRIDLTLEMKNASIKIIKDMYFHYYKDTFPEYIDTQIKDYIISPAQIVNLRLHNSDKNDFIKELLNSFKIDI